MPLIRGELTELNLNDCEIGGSRVIDAERDPVPKAGLSKREVRPWGFDVRPPRVDVIAAAFE